MYTTSHHPLLRPGRAAGCLSPIYLPTLPPTHLDDDVGGVEDLVELAPDAPRLPLLEQVVPPLLRVVLHLHDARVPAIVRAGDWPVVRQGTNWCRSNPNLSAMRARTHIPTHLQAKPNTLHPTDARTCAPAPGTARARPQPAPAAPRSPPPRPPAWAASASTGAVVVVGVLFFGGGRRSGQVR